MASKGANKEKRARENRSIDRRPEAPEGLELVTYRSTAGRKGFKAQNKAKRKSKFFFSSVFFTCFTPDALIPILTNF